MPKHIQKGLKDLIKYMQKNSMAILSSLLIIALILYLYRMTTENFRFKQPDLELEANCIDYGYVCCRSSYMREPKLIQKCRGGSLEGNYFYYKYMGDDREIITSGLYNDYLIHAPGSIMRFSDDKLYKLVSLDPTMKPPNCRIDNESTYDYTQSNIGGSY